VASIARNKEVKLAFQKKIFNLSLADGLILVGNMCRLSQTKPISSPTQIALTPLVSLAIKKHKLCKKDKGEWTPVLLQNLNKEVWSTVVMENSKHHTPGSSTRTSKYIISNIIYRYSLRFWCTSTHLIINNSSFKDE